MGGLGRAIQAVVALLVLGILSRELSGDELGRFALWSFLLVLLDVTSDFGTGNLTLERGAADDWAFTSYLAGARRVRTWVFCVAFSVALVALILIEDHDRGWLALGLLAPLSRRFEASGLSLQRAVRWEPLVALRASGAVIRGLGVWLLAREGFATAGPFLAWTGVTQFAVNLAIHRAAKPLCPKPTIAVALPRDLWRAAWPLALASIAGLLHVQLDYVWLRALLGEAELGTYHVAARIYSYATWLPVLATQAALPVLARARERGVLPRTLGRYSTITTVALVAFLLPVAPFLDELLALAFGEDFRRAAAPLSWLLVTAVWQASQAWWVTTLVAIDRGKTLLSLTLAALGLNALLNAVAVPRLGLDGAALATLASETAFGLAAFGLLWREGAVRRRSLALAFASAAVFTWFALAAR